jgi:hypothetical protein
MATQRLESGQMQLRSVGGVPMVQPQQQAVDFVGPRAAAQGASQLAQVLDRMSASAFQLAAPMRQQEGLQYAADNPLTSDQIQMAKDGVPLGIGSTSSLNFFDQAVAKARSLEISGHFEIEGRNELTKLLADVKDGRATSAQVSSKIRTMTDGLSKSLSSIDPEASIKFRATMATHGHTVLNAAYTAELEREKSKRYALVDSDIDNQFRILEETVSQGSVTINGKPYSVNEIGDVIRKNILTQSMLLGDKAIQKEYSTKFEVAFRNAKINGVTKELMTDANMADPELTLQKLRSGDLGKMSPVLKDLITNDFDAVAKVTANFMVAINNRKSIKDAKQADEKRVGEGKAINLLEQIFPLPEGSPKRKQLVNELIALPEGSVPIGMLKDILKPSGDGDSALNFNLLAGIYNNTITTPDQIYSLVGKGLTAKDAVAALKIMQSEDRRDSSTLDRGISQLSGIPVIPGSVVVIDPKGEEFKRRTQLQAEALQIQSAAAAEGKMLTPRQVLTQLEDNIAKRRNTEDAKAATKQLEEFAKRSDGTYKQGRDWITGPVTRDNLPALRQKAGNDQNKLRQIAELEKLLKRSEGN